MVPGRLVAPMTATELGANIASRPYLSGVVGFSAFGGRPTRPASVELIRDSSSLDLTAARPQSLRLSIQDCGWRAGRPRRAGRAKRPPLHRMTHHAVTVLVLAHVPYPPRTVSTGHAA